MGGNIDQKDLYTFISSKSGTYEILGLSKNGNHLLERVGNDPLWNVHICQIKHQYSTTSRMSEKSLIIYSLTAGEYICICLKPWIITSRTIKEKTVATLQFIWFENSQMKREDMNKMHLCAAKSTLLQLYTTHARCCCCWIPDFTMYVDRQDMAKCCQILMHIFDFL